MTCGSPSAVQVIPLKNNLKIMVKEKFVKLISLLFRGLGQISASHFQQGGPSPQEKQTPKLTPSSRLGGIKVPKIPILSSIGPRNHSAAQPHQKETINFKPAAYGEKPTHAVLGRFPPRDFGG
jgi:hypothetical protein